MRIQIFENLILKLSFKRNKSTSVVSGKIEGLTFEGNKSYGFDKILDLKNGSKDIIVKGNESIR